MWEIFLLQDRFLNSGIDIGEFYIRKAEKIWYRTDYYI
jgi:hypothetical protein